MQNLASRLFGRARDLRDPKVFHQMSRVAFLAWVGLGAEGLSSSSYGPEEAFKALGHFEPDGCCKLIFQRDSWYQRLLHNETAAAVERRLQFAGLPMIVMPVRMFHRGLSAGARRTRATTGP
jgi:hypothetical protein